MPEGGGARLPANFQGNRTLNPELGTHHQPAFQPNTAAAFQNLSLPTVAARVSPPGAGGLAVILVSGPQAIPVTSRFLRNMATGARPSLRVDRPFLARWMDGDEHLDDVVIVFSARSAVDQRACICAHGSVRVSERILMCLQGAGAGITRELPSSRAWYGLRPGEDSLLEHLHRARTSHGARWLMAQLQPVLSLVRCGVELLREGRSAEARSVLQPLLNTFEHSRRRLDGATVALVGPPNVGKSTLANCLYDKPWSCTDDVAGTTRDWIEHPCIIDGIPLDLMDTAGLHPTDDSVELDALAQTTKALGRADLLILVVDGHAPPDNHHGNWLLQLPANSARLVVLNKTDLTIDPRTAAAVQHWSVDPAIPVSALHHRGLEPLRAAILHALRLDDLQAPTACLWDPRQDTALRHAFKLLQSDAEQAARLLNDTFLAVPGGNDALKPL